MSRDITTIADTERPAAKAVLARDPDANAALVVGAEYLEVSARNLSAYFANHDSDRSERHGQLMLAAAYGAVAYLLHALHDVDQSAASDAAWDLCEMTDDGQALAEWVGEKPAQLGLDAGAMPEAVAAVPPVAEPQPVPADRPVIIPWSER